ncbi:MAG: phosphoadenylyl-sulfate reductase [Deltaproteobacteria bacterium]|nr:phosphoadenylyl-sulfate reductase [Deltaproteobacteria bacterium]
MDNKDNKKNVSEVSLDELNAMDAEALIDWALTNYGDRVAIGTSFQLSGSVIIDMAAKHHKEFRVFTVDTGRLHKETHEAMAATEKRYDIKVERKVPNAKRVHEMVERFGEFLFFTDKAKQEYCCQLRKVEPNTEALQDVDVWITGLRRDQSKARSSAPKAFFMEQWERTILKLSPLVEWTENDVLEYIDKNNVPYNSLFNKGYDSVGCVICSTPLVIGEEPRSGRWRWFNKTDDKKECGIHLPDNNEKNNKD